jgi:hypothetical protein
MDFISLLCILAGVFALCGAGFDWDWFMEHRKAKYLSDFLGGRSRARIFYIVLGSALVIFGFLSVFGAFAV